MTQSFDSHYAMCWARRTNGVACCTCAPLRVDHNLGISSMENGWRPNREPATETGTGWTRFVERLGLSFWPETERTMLRGQDGWAFSTAVRFQTAAHDLARTDEPYYWSGYHLLALIVERARVDMSFLEAMEALAVAHVYGGLSAEAVTRQLQQLGVWPCRK